MEPPVPLYNEVLGIKNEFLYPSNSKIYEKGPRYNETSLYRGSCVRVKHDSKYLYLQIVSFLPIFFACLRNNTTQNQLQRWRRKSYISTTKILMGNLNWKRYLWLFFISLVFCFLYSPDLKTVPSCYFCCLFLIVHLNFNTLQLSSPIYTTSIVRPVINI